MYLGIRVLILKSVGYFDVIKSAFIRIFGVNLPGLTYDLLSYLNRVYSVDKLWAYCLNK